MTIHYWYKNNNLIIWFYHWPADGEPTETVGFLNDKLGELEHSLTLAEIYSGLVIWNKMKGKY